MSRYAPDQWAAFPVGTHVRCADPDAFVANKARQLRNRSGVVRRHQAFSGTPIVDFPGFGRRKPYQWVPCRPSDLQIVPDDAPPVS